MDLSVSDVFAHIVTNDGGTFFLSDSFAEGFQTTAATDGYMVSRSGEEYVVSVDDFSPADIAAYIRPRFDALLHGAYFGAWVYAGGVYFDLSDRFLDREDAEAIGRRNSQIAIWDIANACEITL